jgi:predicted amidophosphoribosyltransferase
MQNTYACSNVSIHPCVCKEKKIKKLHDIIGKRKRFNIIQNSMRAYITKGDAKNAYFFIIDDVYTTGATFKEMRRSLSDCGAFPEHLFFISIAH